MSLPTHFNIINRGDLLAVIHFPREKTVNESFEFMEFLKSMFQGNLNKLAMKATEEEEIKWFLNILSYDGALTLSESSYDWLVANNYKPQMERVSSYDEAKEGVIQLVKGDTVGFKLRDEIGSASNFFTIEKDFSFKFGIGYGMYDRYDSVQDAIGDFGAKTVEDFEEEKGNTINEYPSIEPIDLSAMNMKEYEYVKEIINVSSSSYEEVIKSGNKYYAFYQ